MTPDPTNLRTARGAAAKLLRERGYAREAGAVLAGEGDDFTEVRTALALLDILLTERREAAAPRPMVARDGRRLAGEEC